MTTAAADHLGGGRREGGRAGDVHADGGEVIWSETRPAEGGRTALVRMRADGSTMELLAPGQNARTAVHEYGSAPSIAITSPGGGAL